MSTDSYRGLYRSVPFARWQGSFANLHGLEFAAHVAAAELGVVVGVRDARRR